MRGFGLGVAFLGLALKVWALGFEVFDWVEGFGTLGWSLFVDFVFLGTLLYCAIAIYPLALSECNFRLFPSRA